MRPSFRGVKQISQDFTLLAVDVFTSGKGGSVARSLLLLFSCSLLGLLLSLFLFLYLLYTLDYETAAAGGIAGGTAALLAVALFLSKRARCLGTLFLISVFMKKSRNLLLAAGTSLVVLKNIRNTLENLKGLLRSLICNLRMKKASMMVPLSNYVAALKWIGGVLKGVADLGVVNLDTRLKISPRLEASAFREKLLEAEQRLNQTVRRVQAVADVVFSVADRLFPLISLLVLAIIIFLHMRKYCNNMKYQNKFISRRFIRFDKEQEAEGKPHVLPLTPEEEKIYVPIPSARPSSRESRAAVKFGLPILSHCTAWALFMSLDVLMYYFVDIVTRKLSELEPLQIPLRMSIKDIPTLAGIPLEEENHQRDFSYSVTLFEKECLPQPRLLLYDSVAPLVAILLTLLVMVALASKLSQLRLMVCERFLTEEAQRRVEYLHAKILRRRQKRCKETETEDQLTTLMSQLQFWCPLLFKPKVQETQITV